jgi:hypothetical protein
MPTIDDINVQKDVVVAILDQKVFDAILLKNSGAVEMDPTIHALMEQRQAVFLQAYVAALDAPEMTRALAALQRATTQMNIVAARMVTAANFIANVADLGIAANKVVTALQRAG